MKMDENGRFVYFCDCLVMFCVFVCDRETQQVGSMSSVIKAAQRNGRAWQVALEMLPVMKDGATIFSSCWSGNGLAYLLLVGTCWMKKLFQDSTIKPDVVCYNCLMGALSKHM